jgi:phosphonate transport system substrate-binding protein
VVLVTVLVVLMLTGGAGAATDVGTPDNPVRLSVAHFETPSGAEQILADALHDMTGLEFVVDFVEFDEPAIEWLCTTYPENSVRIMGAVQYIRANDLCGADTKLQLVIADSDRYYTEFLVPSSSGLSSLEDLTGLDWYYSDEGSVSGYVVPLGMLIMAGVEPGERHESGGHNSAVLAVYLNEGSGEDPLFGTAFFDARGMLASTYSDVFDKVRILLQSPGIPHSPVVFGPEFPADVRRQIEKALVMIAESPDEVWEDSVGALTSATGLDRVKKKEFTFLRSVLDAIDSLDG